MKFAVKTLVAATAFAAMGSAFAGNATLNVGASVTDSGWTLSDLSGSGRLVFSDTLISALNTAAVQFETVAPATLNAPKDSSGKYTKGGTVYADAPVQALSGAFDGTTFSVTQVATAGGAKQITVKNGATLGAGWLSISNLTVDLTAKIVRADLDGGNGFTAIKQYDLWSFQSIDGPTSFSVPDPAAQSVFNVSNGIHGLFFVNQADGLAKFSQALNLNSTGTAALKAVDNKASTTNLDPATKTAAGFGWINSTISVTATPVTAAVPEPSTYALMGLGLVGLGFATRRRAK
ncbi:PEP-CTERM sorting domain-containing protein [Aquabacterium sp.]|uniref:PEP-CTERM sorting domain-containing protein n=1 Tax=Aquabacterium sp. TaxID=1872578 RepID=UPI0035C68B4E